MAQEAPIEQSRTAEPTPAEYDVDWSSNLSGEEWGKVLIETVFTKGYCVIQMSTSGPENLRKGILPAAKGRTDWTMPKPEFEAAYMGYGSRSKVVWLDSLPKPAAVNALTDPLAYYMQRIGVLSTLLVPAVQSALGFKPGTHVSGSLLRMPLTTADEDLLQEGLNEQDVEKGHVEKHLDFVQRRRLCMLYMVETQGGKIELHPRSDLDEEAMSVPISKDKLLVFNHDMMTYSYLPLSAEDLVLQAWFMTEPQQLSLGNFKGDQASLEALFGGPPQATQEQLHVMSGMCRLPGRAYGMERFISMAMMQTDTFLKIPQGRWDVDAYFSAESGQFNTMGKSVQQHSGLLDDRELMNFDNVFWNIDADVAACIAPCQRVLLEVSYEMLVMGGHSRKSLRGSPMSVFVGDCALDWDVFGPGYCQTPNAWLKAGSQGFAAPTASRLSYMLGLVGNTMTVDTACSASMVAAGMLHKELLKSDGGEPGGGEGITTGHSNLLSPFPFIGLSAAGMIGRAGRCMTFDQSANGFARGEGIIGIFVKRSQDIQVTQNRLGCFVSSYINQDGRSASLTAPNGPSQQMCIRGSLRLANFSLLDHTQTENHGTGTALGDPIETGSICRVFAGHDLLPITSGKTMVGHSECAAGVTSILKVLNTLMHSVVCGNNHLRQLNSHMMDEGFPSVYPNALMDIPRGHAVMGMNAFGFGGTNSRGEFWSLGRQLRNPREVVSRGINGLRIDKLGPAALLPRELDRLDCITVSCPKCMGEACWLCGAAMPPEAQGGKHHCSAIREEFASYEYCSNCYEGGYQWGTSLPAAALEGGATGHSRGVYLVGTFNAWASFEEMTEVRGGVYVGHLTLGNTRLERFRLVVDRDASRAIFPVVCTASPAVSVTGPRADAQQRSWAIDGRRAGVPAGSEYKVTFEWRDDRKLVSWELTGRRIPIEEGLAAYPHRYSIARRSTGWKLEDMDRSASGADAWEWSSSMGGGAGEEEFHFVRDRDLTQTIYPLLPGPSDESVPVMGPDGGGAGRGWLVRGGPHDVLSVAVQISDGDLSVSVTAKHFGKKFVKSSRRMVWRSADGGARNYYYIAGSWALFALGSAGIMEPDPGDPDIYRYRFPIGMACYEEFHIAVNASPNMQLHPACASATPGESLLCGPGDNQDGLNWQVQGPWGQVMEVILNLAAEDHCSMLTCCPVPQSYDEEPAHNSDCEPGRQALDCTDAGGEGIAC